MAKWICHTTTMTVNSVLIGQVRSITPPNPQRGEVDSTCLDTASETRTKLAGLIDPGDCEFEIAYDPSLAAHTGLETLQASGDIVACSIAWPDATTNGFNAFIKSLAPQGGESETLLLARVTLCITGVITW